MNTATCGIMESMKINAGVLVKLQKIITPALTILGKGHNSHATLKIGDYLVSIPKKALGELGKTFPKSEELSLSLIDLGEIYAKSLRVDWPNGYITLTDEINCSYAPPHAPTNATIPALDVTQMIEIADTPGTGKEKAMQILGGTAQEAQDSIVLEKIDKAWADCTKRSRAICSLAHGKDPKYSWRKADNGEALEGIVWNANKLTKAMKSYSKLGGDFGLEVEVLRDDALLKCNDAENDLFSDIEELKEVQEEYTKIYDDLCENDNQVLVGEVRYAFFDLRESHQAWSDSIGSGDDTKWDIYQEMKKTANDSFYTHFKIDPVYTSYNPVVDPAATITLKLKDAEDAEKALKEVNARLRTLSESIFGVNNLAAALTAPQTIIEEE